MDRNLETGQSAAGFSAQAPELNAQEFIDAGNHVREQSATNSHNNGHAEPAQAHPGVQIPDRPKFPSGFPNYQEPMPAR